MLDTNPDTPRHSAPQPATSDRTHTLTLDDVAARFERAGVLRARRSFQRYCETGVLDCIKIDSATGPQYFVAEYSVPRAFESVRALAALNSNPTIARDSAPQPAMADMQVQAAGSPSEPPMARYVERLEHDLERAERENDTKNRQIEALLERDRETNYLVRGLQHMLAPLLAAPKPADREATSMRSDLKQTSFVENHSQDQINPV
jgi:hypothetical protein